MNTVSRIARLAVLSLVAAPVLALAQAATWNIDGSHSRTGFSVKHLVISDVKGDFSKTSGTVQLDEADLSKSSVTATIEAGSVDTRDEKRDGHLKSPDFFDVAKYPTITFKSTKVTGGKDGAITVTGDLTLHGVTKPVTLEGSLTEAIKDMQGNARRGVSLSGKINRRDFGVSYGPAAVIGDDVKLDIQAEIVKAK